MHNDLVDASLESKAWVTKFEPGFVWVRMDTRAGGCGRCDEPGGCRSGLERAANKQSKEYKLAYEGLPLCIGQPVYVKVNKSVPLRAALLGYGLPTLGLIVGAGLGVGMGGGDRWSILGGALGCGVSWIFGKRFAQNRAVHFQVQIIPFGDAMREGHDLHLNSCFRD